MPHLKFNWVDVLFVTLLIRIGYIGFKKGFLLESIKLLGLLFSVVFSINNYTKLADFLANRSTRLARSVDDIVSFLAIFIIGILIFKIVSILVGLFIGHNKDKKPVLVSIVIGLLLGIVRGLVVIGLTYTLFISSPFKYLVVSTKENAFSSKYAQGILPFVYKVGINCYPGEKINSPLLELINEAQ